MHDDRLFANLGEDDFDTTTIATTVLRKLSDGVPGYFYFINKICCLNYGGF